VAGVWEMGEEGMKKGRVLLMFAIRVVVLLVLLYFARPFSWLSFLAGLFWGYSWAFAPLPWPERRR